MLVLTRKLDESLRIGDNIKITVLRVKGNTVRIGIEAPRDVRVVRSELKTMDESPLESDNPSTTVAAIVDSPNIASPRLFVGKVSPDQLANKNQQAGFGHTSDSSQIVLYELSIQDEPASNPGAPLRGFFRGSRGLTAV